MKYYTIAMTEFKCHGHGDYEERKIICKVELRGHDEFPLLYKNKSDAEKALKKLVYNVGMEIVELQTD